MQAVPLLKDPYGWRRPCPCPFVLRHEADARRASDLIGRDIETPYSGMILLRRRRHSFDECHIDWRARRLTARG
jgi:hypothetical protein